MEKQFIPYELALKLKELGFDEECLSTYSKKGNFHRNPSHDMADLPIEGQPYTWINSKIHVDNCAAPLWQQAFDWFREKYNLYAYIRIGYIGYSDPSKTWDFSVYDDISLDYPKLDEKGYSGYKGFTYEEARQACLEKLIELCKKN